MSLFKRIFQKNSKLNVPSVPTWEEIVEMMYGQSLDTFAEEVVTVIYSKDRSMRYVVLKDERDFFTYQLEAIYQYDDEEWKYIRSQDHTLPAMWEPFRGIVSKSVFENTDDLLREIKSEPEYRNYFK